MKSGGKMKTTAQLHEFMCKPSLNLAADMRKITGDIIILGAAGKMGPTLSMLAANAVREAGLSKNIYAVSRFSDDAQINSLKELGIKVIKADLMNEEQLTSLPDAENVIYMVGRKFGTSEDASLTWAMNAYLPGRVAEKYRNSRIVVFSSGNVYPYMPVSSGGATEETPTGPLGSYAQSCSGRENVFKYFSGRYGTKILLFRLNYAIDLRYGILLEIARSVLNNSPVDVTTGNVNVIWQGSANEIAIRSLLHCNCPGEILNVTGPETVSIRYLANEFAKRFNTLPVFSGTEQESCLLSNAAKCNKLFGYPRVSLAEMIDMTAEWVISGGETLDKPTHFQEREGKY
jgi:nucleoside-diphosphate-sugar epimerase